MWAWELLGREPKLDAASTLFDVDAVSQVIATRLLRDPTALEAVTIDLVRYKPGVDLTILYRVAVSDASTFVYVKTFTGRDRHLAVASKSASERRTGRWFKRSVGTLDDPPSVMFAFPNDGELKGLRLLATNAGLARLVTKRCRDFASVDPGSVRGEILRYRPESRCVARADFHDPATNESLTALVKAFASESAATAAFENAREAGDRVVGFRGPAVYGAYHRNRVLIAEFVSGSTVEDTLARGGDVDFADLGRRLAAWQGVARTEGVSPIEREMRRRLRERLALVDDASVREVWTRVLSTPLRRHALHRSHRDFHVGQLLEGGPPTLIDLDGAGLDAPAVDTANFMAVELTRKGLDAGEQVRRAAGLRAFAEAHADALPAPSRVPREGFRTLLALHVLERSTAGIAKLRRSWRKRLASGAAVADAVMNGDID